MHYLLPAIYCLLLPGAIRVASDESPASWQASCDFRCSTEVDDAVVLRAASKRADRDGEDLMLGPGHYQIRSPWRVQSKRIKGVRGSGEVYLVAAGAFDGWLLEVEGLRRAEVTGIGFTGRNSAKGLRIIGCHDSVFRRLHCCGCIEAILVERGWCTYLEAIRVDWCQAGKTPLVDLQQFTGHCRGLMMNRNRSLGPLVKIHGTAAIEDCGIERCESADCVLQFSGRHARIARLHFEGNKAPVQVHATDCRQCEIAGLSLGGSEATAVKVGVLVERSQQTRVDGVIVTHCRDAVVRIGPECVGCEAERIDLHYPRERYRQHGIAPRHLVDVVGSRQ